MRIGLESRFRALLAGIALMAAMLVCGLYAAQAQAAIEIESFTAGAFNADGSANLQAGAHPFEARTAFRFATQDGTDNTPPVENVKDIEVTLPPGLIGNPEATPKCKDEQLMSNSCPAASQVGITTLGLWNGSQLFPIRLPVYNMETEAGQTADFAFLVLLAPVHIVASVNTDGDYSLRTDISDVSELLPLGYSELSFWGVPADPAHDMARGQCGNSDTEQIDSDGDGFPDIFGDGNPLNDDTCPISGGTRAAFLTLPSVCGVPGVTRLRARSWPDPGTWSQAVSAPQQLSGCDRQRFSANISVSADPASADSPTALTVDLRIPLADNPDGLGTPPLRRTVVQLPEGLTVSPAAADGLQGCTAAQLGLGSKADATCPQASKIGTVSIETPLLAEPMEGSIYLAQPTPSRLLGIYLVVKGPGLIVKLPGAIDASQSTGRLTATFDNTPMLPFNRFVLRFKGRTAGPARHSGKLRSQGHERVAHLLERHDRPGDRIEHVQRGRVLGRLRTVLRCRIHEPDRGSRDRLPAEAVASRRAAADLEAGSDAALRAHRPARPGASLRRGAGRRRDVRSGVPGRHDPGRVGRGLEPVQPERSGVPDRALRRGAARALHRRPGGGRPVQPGHGGRARGDPCGP
jgi:hypothetical protein